MDFWDIYYAYHESVKKFALSFVKDAWVADDITQSTFEKVQERFKQLNDPAKTKAWLFRITYNLCQDHFRNAKKELQHARNLAGKVQIQDVMPLDKRLEMHQMNQCVQDKVARLPETLKSVLLMYDVMGFKHQEIADVLDLSPGNVKTRLHRARQKLKGILEKACRLEKDERDILVCEPVGGDHAAENL